MTASTITPDITSEVERLHTAYRGAIQAFSDVAMGLGESDDRDELLCLTARKMCSVVRVERCSLYLRDGETGLYHGQVAADPNAITRVKRLVGGVPADNFTREIVRTRKPVIVSDAQHDPRVVKSTMRTWSVRSMMGVPMVRRDEVIGIFFLDSENEQRTFTQLDKDIGAAFAEMARAAIAQSELLAELRASNRTVATQNRALREAAAVDYRFTRLVTSGASVQTIAETVTELTKKPCVIFDANVRRLTTLNEEESAVNRLLPDPVEEGGEIFAAVEGVSPSRPSVVGPFPREDIFHRLLVAPVTVRDKRWGSVIVFERNGNFNATDALIIRKVASTVALEMSAEQRAVVAEWNARSALVTELIRGNRDADELKRRAMFLGLQLERPHVVCLMTRPEGDGRALPDAETVARTVGTMTGSDPVLATGVVDGIALIVPLGRGTSTAHALAKLTPALAEVCERLDPDGSLAASISLSCESVGDYVEGYEQARQVAGCLRGYCSSASVRALGAADLGPVRLLLSSSEPEKVTRFAEQVLGPLLSDDRRRELLGTVVAFFDCERSVRATAAKLEVHENTVRYRLSRVERAIGLDVLSSSDAQLSLQVALLVVRLRSLAPDLAFDS
jgi:sugar diacid utilization regulator